MQYIKCCKHVFTFRAPQTLSTVTSPQYECLFWTKFNSVWFAGLGWVELTFHFFSFYMYLQYCGEEYYEESCKTGIVAINFVLWGMFTAVPICFLPFMMCVRYFMIWTDPNCLQWPLFTKYWSLSAFCWIFMIVQIFYEDHLNPCVRNHHGHDDSL